MDVPGRPTCGPEESKGAFLYNRIARGPPVRDQMAGSLCNAVH